MGRVGLLYLLAFCRLVIGLVFLLSFSSKVVNIQRFRLTIESFHILPKRLSGTISILFLGSELTIVICLTLGVWLLFPGFMLALLLLLLFAGSLLSILARRIYTTCNCFGTSEKPITILDIWRNAGFILCTAVGGSIALWSQQIEVSLDWEMWLLASLSASAFLLIWLRLPEIIHVFSSLRR